MDVTTILKQHGLKQTRLRVALLGCFARAAHAQSYLDIKKELGDTVDKSTLYRNLSAFESAGIIHRINDQSGIAKYAFGKVHDHGKHHAHFVCERCKTVYCIEAEQEVQLNVPNGFTTNDIQTVIKGTCVNC